MMQHDKAATLGVPSLVWRFGQARRFELIQTYAPLAGRRVLVDGCGIGTYVRRIRNRASCVAGIDVDFDRVAEGAQTLPNLSVSVAEALPFPDGSFDVVLLHEVLEHVEDDRQAVLDAWRVLTPGGRVVIFVPNRLYPFETHGFYWRGEYHFGNVPLINYLPGMLRDRLAPHVRAYTSAGLHQLFAGLDYRVIVHTQIYPGYDKIVSRRPALGRLFRALTYALELTPLRVFGLSHFLVVEKIGD
ncbi:MAG: putative S-adenosylmethionine-dependent methyltransferase [Anaerolineales bacterium]|nr:putative S-adenosylmethionine-dependent methyltransferase [Anaerolineales bacterium]